LRPPATPGLWSESCQMPAYFMINCAHPRHFIRELQTAAAPIIVILPRFVPAASAKHRASARCLSGILSDVQPRLACTLDKMIRDLPPPASVIAQEECSPSDRIFGRKRGKLLSGAFEVLAKISACVILLTEVGMANRPFQEHARRWIGDLG